MAYYKTGEFIKQLREQRGMTQDELAGKVIDRSALSRIERGVHAPRKSVVDYLLSKMGYALPQPYMFLLDENEMNVYTLRERLDKCVSFKRWEKADAVADEMERLPAFQSGLHKQYLLRCKAAGLLDRNRCVQTAFKWLDEAIRITMPRYKEKLVSAYLLSREEILIIYNMCRVHKRSGRLNTAIELLRRLEKSIVKTCADEKEKAHSLSLVLYKLSVYLRLAGHTREAVRKCDEGICLCAENDEYNRLPFLLLCKSYLLYDLKDKSGSIKQLLKCYYLSLAMLRDDLAEQAKKFAEESYGVLLDDLAADI